MDRTAAFLSILAVLILSGGLLYVFLSEDIDQRNAVSPSPSATPTTVIESDPTASWNTYTSEEHGFTISYPEEITVDEPAQIDGIRFYVLGPTQTEGTEMFDGISMNINTDTFTEDDFHDFVDAEYEETSTDPMTSEISDLEHVEIGGHEAHRFTVSALGEFTHIYIELDDKRYAHITYLVEDPTDQGYEDIVNQMLSSLVI